MNKNIEVESLGMLAEECGEILHVAGKSLRHGLACQHPATGEFNWALLELEIGDFMAVYAILCRLNVIDPICVAKRQKEKLMRLQQYLHHIDLKQLGLLDEHGKIPLDVNPHEA